MASKLEADLLDLLYQNISRLDESLEADREGVYHILGRKSMLRSRSPVSDSTLEVLESLVSDNHSVDAVGNRQSMVLWLQSRASAKEKVVGQNKQYAAEVLAILLQTNSSARKLFLEKDGVDMFLQLISSYRKRDPEKGTDEEEYFENVFDCLICCVDDPMGKKMFLDAEGIELCLIMLRDGKMSRPRALKLLNHALGDNEGASCCERFVEAAGLKPIFALFMKKVSHLPFFLRIPCDTDRGNSKTARSQNIYLASSPRCSACYRSNLQREYGCSASSWRKTTKKSADSSPSGANSSRDWLESIRSSRRSALR
jgi:beta-catenin-like protein 1